MSVRIPDLVRQSRRFFQRSKAELVGDSWFVLELGLLFQTEIRRLIREQNLCSAELLAEALRVSVSEAEELLASVNDRWPLDVQMAALERLSDLQGSTIGAAEFISGLWLASKFTEKRLDDPFALVWKLGSGDLSVLLRSDGSSSPDPGWQPQAQPSFGEPGSLGV